MVRAKHATVWFSSFPPHDVCLKLFSSLVAQTEASLSPPAQRAYCDLTCCICEHPGWFTTLIKANSRAGFALPRSETFNNIVTLQKGNNNRKVYCMVTAHKHPPPFLYFFISSVCSLSGLWSQLKGRESLRTCRSKWKWSITHLKHAGGGNGR